MNRELKTWCADSESELRAEPERRKPMSEFIDRHPIIFNPVIVLIVLHVIAAIVFAVLGLTGPEA